MNTIAKKDYIFVLTNVGYDKTPDRIKQERAINKPIKLFEYAVPTSWIINGYVKEIKEVDI